MDDFCWDFRGTPVHVLFSSNMAEPSTRLCAWSSARGEADRGRRLQNDNFVFIFFGVIWDYYNITDITL